MRTRPTNDNDSHRSMVTMPGGFVLEGDLFIPMTISLVVMILLWMICLIVMGFHIVSTAIIALIPPLLTAFYLITFINGKPPGYKNNLFNLLLFGNARWYVSQSQPQHPLTS